MIHYVTTTPLDGLVTIRAMTSQVESGIVDIESAVKARRSAIERIENQRSDECAGVIAVLFQEIRQVRKVLRQGHAKIIHVIELREGSREDGRVRCRSQR